MTEWNQFQASWFIGSPTLPNFLSEDLSYLVTHSSPYLHRKGET